jgi:hypothetical protein
VNHGPAWQGETGRQTPPAVADGGLIKLREAWPTMMQQREGISFSAT